MVVAVLTVTLHTSVKPPSVVVTVIVAIPSATAVTRLLKVIAAQDSALMTL